MNDVFPLLDVSVAALTFVLGFMSARHHSHLSAARALVHRLGEELEVTGGASRDRARQLLLLARQGLQRDWVVMATVASAWAWAAGNAGVAAWGQSVGGPELGSVQKAVGAVVISVVVASLGTWDIIAVDRQLRLLEDRTIVGLLSQAAEAVDRGRFDEVIAPTTRAASRNPTLAWPFAYRARAYVELAGATTGEERRSLRAAARRDMRRVIEREPAQFAGLLDWFADGGELVLDEQTTDLLLRHLTTPERRIHAARRLRSHVDGVLRRQLIGRRGSTRKRDALRPAHGQTAATALAHWRDGDVAGALATVEDLLARRERSGLDLGETVVAAGILQLVGREQLTKDLLDDLLAPDADVPDLDIGAATNPGEDDVLIRIACVFGMQLREVEDGSGTFSNAADRWEAAAIELDLDDAILTLARHVFTDPTDPDRDAPGQSPRGPAGDTRPSPEGR